MSSQGDSMSPVVDPVIGIPAGSLSRNVRRGRAASERGPKRPRYVGAGEGPSDLGRATVTRVGRGLAESTGR